MNRKIFVAGGAGYIGSHTCIALLNAGYKVIAFDNFSKSDREVIRRVEKITRKSVVLIEGDIRDKHTLMEVMYGFNVDAVIHLAGLKAVGESVVKPLLYYDNNVNGTIVLLKAMHEIGVKILLFSSSATVYGDPKILPVREDHLLSATNPYGRSKLKIESILRDFYLSAPEWRVGILRYFNPAGAHESGLIGENPQGIPDNLMPFIAQVAAGKRECLKVFGSDYPTPDGTCVRDYIHVMDLAAGHLRALEKLGENNEYFTVNLGTGRGYSVLDLVATFEKVSGRKIPCHLVGRRPGDVASCYADPSYAEKLLGWKAKRDLVDMCGDSWRWQSENPNGYGFV